ncbi:hypothetical protein [Mycobacterium sp. AZCC_0083]|uniref:hypothetical protein n=1 Tax=Mycobacterium sp. AZCC_0083 TaxID=2735882 RepID=UPI0017A48167|nr:hypothetical protein [Mycobacterium sp. AZCC_0083]MBB5163722.1 hypothetical protein [Mycobacterium sp. AZCC_0083]
MGYTHVTESNGGALIVEMGHRAEIDEFAGPLRRFNGIDRFALTLWALPVGMNYDQARALSRDALEYIQAAGKADALTVEIRTAGGSEWGAEWVRYVVGHANSAELPTLELTIELPHSTELIARHEVFGADEAADLFYGYYKTGGIPTTYTLRPVEGYASDGRNIDLRGETPRTL